MSISSNESSVEDPHHRQQTFLGALAWSVVVCSLTAMWQKRRYQYAIFASVDRWRMKACQLG